MRNDRVIVIAHGIIRVVHHCFYVICSANVQVCPAIIGNLGKFLAGKGVTSIIFGVLA